MGISAQALLDILPRNSLEEMIDCNPSCKGMLTGYIAEKVLSNKLLENSRIGSVDKIPDHDAQKGDLKVLYRGDDGDKVFTIEVKCLKSNSSKSSVLEGGVYGRAYLAYSDSTEIDNGVRTSLPLRGCFDILAVCTITITGTWDFFFIHNKYLDSSPKFPNRLKGSFCVNTQNTPCLHSDIDRVIQDIN